MIKVCPICKMNSLKEIQHDAGKHYFLCTVDTSVNPASIDIGTGMRVDALACTNCGAILLNNPDVIGK